MESKDGAGWVVQNSDRSMDEEIRNIGPCLCGDYGPHQGCVDSEHWNVMGTGIFIPNPVCICGHPLNWHGSDGCNHDVPGVSFGPEATASCYCEAFEEREDR